MLLVKKCRNLRGYKNIFLFVTVNIFLMPKIWKYFFFPTAFVDKIIRGNMIHEGKYLPQKGEVCENNERLTFTLFILIIDTFSGCFHSPMHQFSFQDNLVESIDLNSFAK